MPARVAEVHVSYRAPRIARFDCFLVRSCRAYFIATRPHLRQGLFLQSRLGHTIQHRLPPAEGLRLEENKQAVRIVKLVKGQYQLVGYRMRDLLRDDHSSPTAITCSEMMAHCGMAEKGAVTAAQIKVNEWPVLTAQFRQAMTVYL